MDGVHFVRLYEDGPNRKRLDPGPTANFLAVKRGEIILDLEFPQFGSIRLRPGDGVAISGLSQHALSWGEITLGQQIGRFHTAPMADRRSKPSDVEAILGVFPNEAMALSNMIMGPMVVRETLDHPFSRHIWNALTLLEDETEDATGHIDRDQVVRRVAEIMSINVNRAISSRGDERYLAFTARRADAYNPRVSGIWRALGQFLETPFGDWSVALMARNAHMSRTSFCEAFKIATGSPPAKLVARVRLSLIANLLVTKEPSVEEAADFAGYNSAAAFIRAFKKQFGRTPAQWRSNQP